MPFQIHSAAAHEKRVVVPFDNYEQKVTLWYNAGEQYREFQLKAQGLEQEMSDLQRRLGEDGQADAATYEELRVAMAGARRRIADNICAVINRWDLEARETITLNDIKARMSKKDREKWTEVSGEGEIPVSGAWLDALPLPDEFILSLVEGITSDFDSGGQAGKALSRAT
jgi:hypothetical protein